jgi:hypothetical protein
MEVGLARDAHGAWPATALPDQDSSLAKTLARADGLIIRATRAAAAPAGESFRMIRLEGTGGARGKACRRTPRTFAVRSWQSGSALALF